MMSFSLPASSVVGPIASVCAKSPDSTIKEDITPKTANQTESEEEATTPNEAKDEDWVPTIKKIKGNLTIKFHYNDDQTSTPIEGANITIYKVADLLERYHTAIYTPSGDFTGISLDHFDLTTDQVLAQQLYDSIAKKSSHGMTTTTDKTGQAYYKDLDVGLYLVAETGQSGMAAEYSTFAPYLVSVPFPVPNADGHGNEWNYDFVSEPKAEIKKKEHPQKKKKKKKPKSPTSPNGKNTTPKSKGPGGKVQTGDELRMAYLFGTALILFVVTAYIAKRKKDSEETD